MGRFDGAQSSGPAHAGVSEAVKEDQSGRMSGRGLNNHRRNDSGHAFLNLKEACKL